MRLVLSSEHPNSSAMLPAARKLALVKNAWSYFIETAATAHSRCGTLENGKQMCTVPASPCMLYPLLAVAGFNCQVLSSPFRQTAARSLMIPGMPSEHDVAEFLKILKLSIYKCCCFRDARAKIFEFPAHLSKPIVWTPHDTFNFLNECNDITVELRSELQLP